MLGLLLAHLVTPFKLRKFKNFANVFPHEVPPFGITMRVQHVPVSSRTSTGQNIGPEHRACTQQAATYVQTATRVMASFAEMRCNDEVAETIKPHGGASYSRLERRGRTETLALLPGIEDLGLGVLVTLEPLVAAPLASAAVRATLDLHHPVEALVIAAAHRLGVSFDQSALALQLLIIAP